MSPTVVEITPRGDGIACALSGDLVVPRMVRRHGRSAAVALVAGRAMLLPGDEVHIRIDVGDGCALELVDIGGLIVYGRDGEERDESQWHARIDLGADARLTWAGLPTVVTDAGVLSRSLTMTLAEGASASLRETLVLGRAGERGGRVTADTDIADARGPVLRERFTTRGDRPVPGVLGDMRVMDSLIAVGDHVPFEPVRGATLLELERGATVLRYIGDDAHASPLGDVGLGRTRHDADPARVG